MTGKEHKADSRVCKCVVCRHVRGEVSDDYYRGIYKRHSESRAILEGGIE